MVIMMMFMTLKIAELSIVRERERELEREFRRKVSSLASFLYAASLVSRTLRPGCRRQMTIITAFKTIPWKSWLESPEGAQSLQSSLPGVSSCIGTITTQVTA